MAGLSVWSLLVPQSLAYATIAGVPVQYGLHTAFVALIAYPIFGTSRHLVQGTSAAVLRALGRGDHPDRRCLGTRHRQGRGLHRRPRPGHRRRLRLIDAIGTDAVFETVHEAVRAVNRRIAVTAEARSPDPSAV